MMTPPVDPSRFADPAHLSQVLERRVLPLVSRPARYLGGELGAEPGTSWRADGLNALLCFPDAYEVGMSHTGLRVLYSLLLERENTFCDLAFTPWPDMEETMRREGLPLFGLQSRRSARQFDLVGFSVGYELAYTNVLTMLDLAGVALRADQRVEGDPIIVAGGSCVMNPSVVGPFCDILVPGDGEEALLEIADAVAGARARGASRAETLDAVRAVKGAWWTGVTEPVSARVVADLNQLPVPRTVVPITEPVHDRLAVEVMRGCARGCRFCQAGMIQRPVRERDVSAVVRQAAEQSRAAGYDEVGLLSLSTGDYSGLGGSVAGIQDGLEGTRTNLVLPSLRMDSLDPVTMERVGRERPASVTFAPEAGTQRLRNVINKNITEDEILAAVKDAFRRKVGRIKLYFMIGLPTETNDDLDGIVALVGRVIGLAPRGGSQVTVSISPFAPKAHTPFQWAGQISPDEIHRRNQYLDKRLRRLKAKVSLRDPDVSVLEAVLGLGDGRLADVVETAWRQGARFDSWDEGFDVTRWQEALTAHGVNAAEITAPRDLEAPLPWRTVLGPVADDFHRREWQRALAGEVTPDCRLEGGCEACAACGDGLSHVAAELAPLVSEQQSPAAQTVSPEPVDDEDPRWRSWRERASAKVWVRLEFARSGALVFLGHLDFQRLLHQSLRRSGLPVAYSKGYHPHPLVKYGPPVPVGVAGEHEVLDLAFEWNQPGWQGLLQAALPPGLDLVRAIPVGSITPPSIDGLAERFDFRVELPPVDGGGPTPDAAHAAVESFMAAETWPWTRRRHGKPDKNVDARTLIPEGGLSWLAHDPLTLQLSLLRGEGAGLPVHDFLAALFGADLPEPRFCAVTRTRIMGRDDTGRWLSPFDEIETMRRRVWLQAHHND